MSQRASLTENPRTRSQGRTRHAHRRARKSTQRPDHRTAQLPRQCARHLTAPPAGSRDATQTCAGKQQQLQASPAASPYNVLEICLNSLLDEAADTNVKSSRMYRPRQATDRPLRRMVIPPVKSRSSADPSTTRSKPYCASDRPTTATSPLLPELSSRASSTKPSHVRSVDPLRPRTLVGLRRAPEFDCSRER